MTPRQADLVCALERVEGVLDVFAVAPAEDGPSDIELAVHLQEARPRALAQAHYALAQWLAPYEWRRVLLFEVSLPPFLKPRAERLVLTAEERSQAKRRAPPPRSTLGAELEVDPFRTRAAFACLVVSDDPDVAKAASEAFGPSAKVVVEANQNTAFWRARDESFDLILCESTLAFGKAGLLSELVGMARDVARRVVVLAAPGAVDLVARDLDELRALNSFVSHPISAKDLREVVASGAVVQRWSIPVLTPRAEVEVAKVASRRVLVVDDDPETAMLLASSPTNLIVTVTDDEWEAADAVTADDLALVVCSVSLRTRGGAPFYRFLWTARPDIKSRFVFLVKPDTPALGRAAAVVMRPLTRDALSSLVDARS